MYLHFLVEVSDVQGKITTKKKGNTVYVNYEIGRKYYKDRKYTIFSPKDRGLFLDLIAYTITCENNAGQYYPTYAYGHPLFTEGMHIYSDTKVSDFLCGMTGEESVGFMNDWNASCNHREKIYISYDSTNKNSEAGNIEMVEFGEAKVDVGLPIYHNSNSCLERQRDTATRTSALFLTEDISAREISGRWMSTDTVL